METNESSMISNKKIQTVKRSLFECTLKHQKQIVVFFLVREEKMKYRFAGKTLSLSISCLSLQAVTDFEKRAYSSA
jgi:hypothetical protein